MYVLVCICAIGVCFDVLRVALTYLVSVYIHENVVLARLVTEKGFVMCACNFLKKRLSGRVMGAYLWGLAAKTLHNG